MDSNTYRLYPGVSLAADARIGDYVVIGVPPRGVEPTDMPTVIGPNAEIRTHTVIYAGNVIGANFQTGHGVLIRESNQIGDNVSVGSHTVIEHHIQIGHNVRIHSNAFIPEYSIIEEDAWVGPSVTFTNALYPASPSTKKDLKGPRLRRGAKIGAHATLLPGVTVGRYALVGAGAVVVHDVPDWKVVVGNPARVVRDVRDLGVYPTEVQLTSEGESL